MGEKQVHKLDRDQQSVGFLTQVDSASRGESGLRGQLSTPKFGSLYHFTKVSSDDIKVMT